MAELKDIRGAVPLPHVARRRKRTIIGSVALVIIAMNAYTTHVLLARYLERSSYKTFLKRRLLDHVPPASGVPMRSHTWDRG